MGKALVIKNVNFSTNKLTTVTLIDPIPCTAISLSDSTKSMTSIGSTFTLTATFTPSNTTDSLVWSTSDATKATVENGVVTQTGVGSVTITAACGSQSATCVITAIDVLTYTNYLRDILSKRSESKDFMSITSGGGGPNYAALVKESPVTTRKLYNGLSDGVNKYPIVLAANASKINVTAPDSFRITAWFVDTESDPDYAQTDSSCVIYAKFISGDSSPYDSSVSLGNREINIPSGANAVVFCVQEPGSGNEVTDEDIATITIAVS